MAAKPVIIDATCPGCKKDHAVAVPLDDLQIAVGRVQKDDDREDREVAKKLDALAKELEEIKKPKSEEKPKVVREKEYPSFMPGEICLSGNCEADGVHKNKNYKMRPAKKCTNCDQFSPKGAKKCPWCKKDEFEDLEPEELEELGIPLPAEIEHDHHHHEAE